MRMQLLPAATKGAPDFAGYAAGRVFPNGRVAAVTPMTFGKGRLVMTERVRDWKWSYDDAWCYQTLQEAMDALAKWDGEGEPEGWFRNPRTGRRREGGNPAREYIYW